MEERISSHGEDFESAGPGQVQYSPDEARAVLAGQSLCSMRFGDYLVVLRSEFDVIIAAEPYHALSLLLDLRSGAFLARVWNRTVRRGRAGSAAQLGEACARHFRERRLCLGLVEREGEQQAGLEFLNSQTPVPRKISRKCLGVLSEEAGADDHACLECLKLESHCRGEEAPVKLETSESHDSEDAKVEDAMDDYDSEPVDVSSHLQTVVEEADCEERPFECSDCNSCFATPEDLLQHTSSHNYTHFSDKTHLSKSKNKQHKSKEGQHKCSECDFSATEPSKLKRHMWSHMHATLKKRQEERIGRPKLHKCTECDCSYTTASILKRHMQIKHLNQNGKEGTNAGMSEEPSDDLADDDVDIKAPVLEKQFHCTECSKGFKYASSLQLHLKKAHGIAFKTEEGATAITNDQASTLAYSGVDMNAGHVNRLIECPYCEKEFSWERELLKHKKSAHFYGPFKCPKCRLIQPFAQNLLEHMESKGHRDDPLVYCPCCKIRFDVDEIETHYKKCIRMSNDERLEMAQKALNSEAPADTDSNDSKEKENDPGEKIDPDCKKIQCPYCDQSVGSRPMFYRHKKLTHFWGIFKCSQCEHREFFASDLVDHIRKAEDHDENTLIKCPACRSTFGAAHIKSHYEECITNKYFMASYSAQQKQKQKPKESKICEQCGKVLKTYKIYLRHLKVHVRATISEEEAAQKGLYVYCDRCPKKFTAPTQLRAHMATVHEGKVMPATCSVCGVTFSNKSKLRKHTIIEHSTDEKYQCSYCGKRSETITSLKQHMSTHEEPKFKCSYCGKMLRYKASLEAHEREHRGERPFECEVCGKGFVSDHALYQHKTLVHKILGPRAKPPAKRVRAKK